MSEFILLLLGLQSDRVIQMASMMPQLQLTEERGDLTFMVMDAVVLGNIMRLNFQYQLSRCHTAIHY